MKKRYVIFFSVALVLLSITGCSKKTSVTYKANDFSLLNDSADYGSEYYDEYSYYDMPVNNDIISLSEYVKYFHFVLNYEESYYSLSDEEKAAVITYAAGLSSPQSDEYIKKVAKKYFGEDEYELPLGKYSVIGSGDLSNEEWSINKKNNFYVSSIEARGLDVVRLIDFYDISEKDNIITLKGNYFVENDSKNHSISCTMEENVDNKCIKGYYEYKLERIDDSLVLQSIIYKSNKDYDKNAKVSLYAM